MKTVIEMAREAGIIHPEMVDKTLERFAELVRADERNIVMNEPLTKAQWQRFEDEIRADENEACAEIAHEAEPWCSADLIRARRNK
jgi:hypothetical protein